MKKSHCFLENILPFPATITMYVLDVVCCTRQKVSAAKDKCRISRHRVEVDQIAINLDTTIVDTTINPLLLLLLPIAIDYDHNFEWVAFFIHFGSFCVPPVTR